MTINNPEGKIKIKTNSTNHAVLIGRVFNKACQEIAAKKMTLTEMERELNPDSKFKQKSLTDFFSSDKNDEKGREILISRKKNQTTDKKEEED